MTAIDVSTIEPGQWVVGECEGRPFEGLVWRTVGGALFVGGILIRYGDGGPGYGLTITSVTDSRPDNPRRVVTTVEELDALAVGSVVLDNTDDAWVKRSNSEWNHGNSWHYSDRMVAKGYGPFTVLVDTTPPAPAMEPLPTEPSAIWATGIVTGEEYLVSGPNSRGNWCTSKGHYLLPSDIVSWRYYTGPEAGA